MKQFNVVMLLYAMLRYVEELNQVFVRGKPDFPQYVCDHVREMNELVEKVRKEMDDAD